MRISYSRFSTYRICPQQYKLQYVDRVPVPTTPQLIFGSAVHQALSVMYNPAHLRTPEVEEVVEVFVTAWGESAGRLPEDTRQSYFEQGVDMLRRHYVGHAHREEGRRTAATEMFFSLPFDEEHTLVGRFDRVDVLPENRLELIDYKTTRRMPSHQAVEKDLQLAVYRMAAAHLYPGQQVTMSLLYLLHDYKMTVSPTDEFLDETREEIRYTIARIRAEEFDAKPGSHCDWCSYRQHCPLFRAPSVPDDVETDVTALLEEYDRLNSGEKDMKVRKAELRAQITDYLDGCGAERVESGGYVVERRRSKRVGGWDKAKLRELLEPEGLWEEVSDVSSPAVRAMLTSGRLSAEQRRAVESAASYQESDILRVRKLGRPDEPKEDDG